MSERIIVTQNEREVVEVAAPGPQGPPGQAGIDAAVAAEAVARDAAIASAVADLTAAIAAEAVARDAAIANAVDDEQGVGKMLSGFVPNLWRWRLRTENISGWSAPASNTTLDGVGHFIIAPFTGAVNQLNAPAFNTIAQNTAGATVYLALPVATVEFKGQNGHIYLETSADGATNWRRLDFHALRTGGSS